VLRCISEGGAFIDKGTIKTTFSFQFNASFTSTSKKIRIPMASLEDADRMKNFDEDRSLAIKCAAVKSMKAHKTLSHELLVAEVRRRLALFQLALKDIKKGIEVRDTIPVQ
jgi:cullin 1